MNAKVKTVNYTPEQTAMMAEMFTADNPARHADAKALAEKMGKAAKSVVAKLTVMGLYQAKTYVTKTGEAVQKKDDTADAIGAILQLSEAEASSLAKANKTVLVKIFDALANSRPIDGNED